MAAWAGYSPGMVTPGGIRTILRMLKLGPTFRLRPGTSRTSILRVDGGVAAVNSPRLATMVSPDFVVGWM